MSEFSLIRQMRSPIITPIARVCKHFKDGFFTSLTQNETDLRYCSHGLTDV